MKKTSYKLCVLLAAGLLLASCGKKRLPEIEAAAENAQNGILGKTGKQLVYLIDDYYAELEAYNNDYKDSGTTGNIVKSEEEHSKNREENQQRIKDYLSELSKVEIATEVADGVPLKIVRPFKVTDVACNYIAFNVVVELTEGRPHIRRNQYYNADTFLPTVVPLNDNDSLTFKTPSLFCKAIKDVDKDLEVGYIDTLVFSLSVSDYKNSQSPISQFLGAKKLVIRWDKPTNAIKFDLAKYYGELGLFNLHGLVQTCTWTTSFGTQKLEFDEDGNWVTENGRKPDADYPKVERDEQGRRVKASDSWGETFIEYKYDKEGRLVKKTVSYMDGGSESTYTYDGQGIWTKTKVAYLGMDAMDGEDDLYVYSIIETDAMNNWTKRKNQNGEVETRVIKYFE